ncbi:hypothetical protein [Deinococcus budaensis]|uniref:Uncharacterized protein n=1 Tax=Deinococcus budaensis TaxID=1665626 RepID=A0A7W8GHD1_9DEIO|nr:hypothetical protein [Deinococcus budaensis]MBB5235652.1 hypothetical protein [Deinococcus budaensis]
MTREKLSPEDTASLSWRALETRVGLGALPAFHRAFLTWRGVAGTDEMPLRRVGQRVEAELNRLVQSGQATREGEDWALAPGTLGGFEAARPYLPPSGASAGEAGASGSSTTS